MPEICVRMIHGTQNPCGERRNGLNRTRNIPKTHNGRLPSNHTANFHFLESLPIIQSQKGVRWGEGPICVCFCKAAKLHNSSTAASEGGLKQYFFALTPVIGTLQIKAALEVLECSLIISRRSPVGSP